MPKRAQKNQSDFTHTWYAKDWLVYFGKIQADLVRDLGYPRAKASDIWNGQPYRQELVDELSAYLNLKPFELLMAPDLAMSYRQLKASAQQIANEPALAPARVTDPNKNDTQD